MIEREDLKVMNSLEKYEILFSVYQRHFSVIQDIVNTLSCLIVVICYINKRALSCLQMLII